MKEGYTLVEQIALESNLNAITKVEQIVESFCAQINVSDDCFGNVLIAVSEAVTNAVVHGNGVDSQFQINLSVGDNAHDFYVNVKDQGRGFDYNALPDPTNPENLLNEHGRGIFLMQNLADKVEFEDYGRSVYMFFQK